MRSETFGESSNRPILRRSLAAIPLFGAAAVVAVIVLSTGGSPTHRRGGPALRQRLALGRTSALTPTLRRPTDLTVADLGTQPASGPAGGPSGVPLPSGTPPGWRRVFADDFPAAEDSPLGSFSGCRWIAPPIASRCVGLPGPTQAKWFAEPNGASLLGTDFMAARVLSISGGALRFSLHGGPGGQPYLAAAEPRVRVGGQLGAFQSGLFLVRFRSAIVPGYDIAFELWPVSRDWRDGGLQFPAGDLTGPVRAIIGQVGVPFGNPNLVISTHSSFTRWHTATIEWRDRTVRFFLDGREIGPSHPFTPTSPLRWLLYAGPEISSASNTEGHAGQLQVAWVAAYVPRAIRRAG